MITAPLGILVVVIVSGKTVPVTWEPMVLKVIFGAVALTMTLALRVSVLPFVPRQSKV